MATSKNTPAGNSPYDPPTSHDPSQHYAVRGTESDTPRRERGLSASARGAGTPIPFVLPNEQGKIPFKGRR